MRESGIEQQLIAKGIRPSVQRVWILRYLQSHFTHPTVEEVYDELSIEMPTISKTTIYNTMKLFEQRGVIQIIHVDEKHVRMDADLTPHAHFICMGCGAIHDIPLGISKEKLAEFTRRASVDKSFQIMDTQVSHKGLCNKCLDKQLN